MSGRVRELLKLAAHGIALVVVAPSLVSFRLRGRLMGRDRALEGSTQALGLVPGIAGQYLRRAFLSRALAHCARTAVVEFGTIFSSTGARLDDRAYVGPRCHLGLVHIGRDALLAAGVHVPSGGRTHAFADASAPIREQGGERRLVSIGEGCWVGSAAVVMADIGPGTVVGAGAVVSKPLPGGVVAVGVPARVVRMRTASEAAEAPA